MIENYNQLIFDIPSCILMYQKNCIKVIHQVLAQCSIIGILSMTVHIRNNDSLFVKVLSINTILWYVSKSLEYLSEDHNITNESFQIYYWVSKMAELAPEIMMQHEVSIPIHISIM